MSPWSSALLNIVVCLLFIKCKVKAGMDILSVWIICAITRMAFSEVPPSHFWEILYSSNKPLFDGPLINELNHQII